MPSILLVMLGGALGAGARHLTGRFTLAWWGPDYPWGTLAVNLIGGFLMGLLAGGLLRFGDTGEQMRLFLGVGILGGFTTFSAFSLDAMLMLERGEWFVALGYILASVIGSVVALAIGLQLTRAVA